MGLPLPSAPILECELPLENGARVRFSVRRRHFREKGSTADSASKKSSKTMEECRRTIFPDPKGKKQKKN